MKRFIKSFLYFIGSLRRSRKSRVIYYHDVYDDCCYTNMGTRMEDFLSHLKIIENLAFQIVEKITDSEGQIQICFDDGFRGIWDTREIFYERGIKPTVFIPIGLIGQEGYLKKEEILELQAHGFIFQGHSWNHDNLPHYGDEELWHELYDAKKELEEILGKEVDSICFPQGYFSTRVIEFSKKAGYRYLYSSLPGAYDWKMSLDIIPRSLAQSVSNIDFKRILLGGDGLFFRSRLALHYRNQ